MLRPKSAHSITELRLLPNTVKALRALRRAGYDLIVVSNQPSFAKQKTTLEALHAVADEFERRLRRKGVELRSSYYCFHHPQGAEPGYGRRCRCRKPSPYFLRQAAHSFDIDLRRSWMVGDRLTDIECGSRAGCRTILITKKGLVDRISLRARNIAGAARLILRAGQATPPL